MVKSSLRLLHAAPASLVRAVGVHALRPAIMLVLLASSPLAWATSRCPPQAGAKDPTIDLLGWLVLAAGVAAGMAMFGAFVWRTRAMRWPARCAVLLGGLAAMLLVWVGSLALAFTQFFLRC